MKAIELFGGIGAFSEACKNVGGVEIIDYVEIDKNAVKSYNALNNTNYQPTDIRDYNLTKQCDILIHGSPCQDFSLAGKQLGAIQGTRSGLLYETLRIIKETKYKPKYIIWENVKNLLSKKMKPYLDDYIDKLKELGYNSTYDVINAIDFGIPQTRERMFVVSQLGGSLILIK